jgi:hypothetical protein
LQLAANSKHGEIAWGVVAGVVALLYAAIVLVKRKDGPSLLGWSTKREPTYGGESEPSRRTSSIDARLSTTQHPVVVAR